MTQQIPPEDLGSPLTKWELTVGESFSFAALYKRIHDFLVETGWKDMYGADVDSGGDDYEQYYSERVVDGMTTHNIWWRATRRPTNHGNKYYQSFLLLDMQTPYMGKTEVMHNGKKLELDKGELRITCQLFLSKGHGKAGEEWESRPLLSFFKQRFWERENKAVLGSCEQELFGFSNDLHELIQTFTGIKPEGEVKDFVPIKGTHN